jgi:hypothetical protein
LRSWSPGGTPPSTHTCEGFGGIPDQHRHVLEEVDDVCSLISMIVDGVVLDNLEHANEHQHIVGELGVLLLKRRVGLVGHRSGVIGTVRLRPVSGFGV